jgi:putative addiction module component (TIGR02574 family)
MMILSPDALQKMPVSDRLRLIEEVWTSLAEKADALEVPEWHRQELDARLDAHGSEPATLDWAVAKADLQRKSRR